MSEYIPEHNQFECPCCFLLWNEEPLDDVHDRTIIKLCTYCAVYSWLTKRPLLNAHSIQLLRRRMEVFHTTLAFRLPEVLAHLFEHVKLNDEEDY